MGLGAIVAIGFESEAFCFVAPDGAEALLPQPLAYFDVLGCSPLERIVQRFIQADVEVVSVLVKEGADSGMPSLRKFENVSVEIAGDLRQAIAQTLANYSAGGIDHSFLVAENVYAETDLLDLFYFHREARQAITRAIDREAALNLWVLDCEKAQSADLRKALVQTQTGTSYFIREYVNRLRHPVDLRRFASDMLQGRCAVRPPGRQSKRGVWVDDGAEIHRRARIVAPAYIGRACQVMEDTLITRCSNVEEHCCVDYGTVIENSSVLQNTHIGICLDVCHSVANASLLLSLRRNVAVEISDPNLMRANNPGWKPAQKQKRTKNGFLFNRRRKAEQQKLVQRVVNLKPAGSAPEPFGIAPILYRSERNA